MAGLHTLELPVAATSRPVMDISGRVVLVPVGHVVLEHALGLDDVVVDADEDHLVELYGVLPTRATPRWGGCVNILPVGEAPFDSGGHPAGIMSVGLPGEHEILHVPQARGVFERFVARLDRVLGDASMPLP